MLIICHFLSAISGGVLVMIMNYTGDVLNFGLAVEMARNLGHNVSVEFNTNIH